MDRKGRNCICQLLFCSSRSREPAGFVNIQFLANQFIKKLGASQGSSKILNIGFQRKQITIVDKSEMLNPRNRFNNCCPPSHQNVNGYHRGCITLSHTVQIGQAGFRYSMPHAQKSTKIFIDLQPYLQKLGIHSEDLCKISYNSWNDAIKTFWAVKFDTTNWLLESDGMLTSGSNDMSNVSSLSSLNSTA